MNAGKGVPARFRASVATRAVNSSRARRGLPVTSAGGAAARAEGRSEADVEATPFDGGGDDLPLKVGARVRHGRWGEGLVVGVERSGGDTLVTVRFASVGRKQISLQYAQLEEL